MLKQIVVIGSGNWGSAIGRLVAKNVLSTANQNNFHRNVVMWVYEETVNSRLLSNIINEEHENVKYLPGVKLPSNLIANTDLYFCCQTADILIFVIPHNFLPSLLDSMKGRVKKGAIAVSLIKGLVIDEYGPKLLSSLIQTKLNIDNVAVLMGANIANDIAKDEFAESTLACKDTSVLLLLQSIFQTQYFHVQISMDVNTVEICGAYKNIIALGAGMCDGLGVGDSTKAALIRQGIQEMNRFCELFSKTYKVRIVCV